MDTPGRWGVFERENDETRLVMVVAIDGKMLEDLVLTILYIVALGLLVGGVLVVWHFIVKYW